MGKNCYPNFSHLAFHPKNWVFWFLQQHLCTCRHWKKCVFKVLQLQQTQCSFSSSWQLDLFNACNIGATVSNLMKQPFWVWSCVTLHIKPQVVAIVNNFIDKGEHYNWFKWRKVKTVQTQKSSSMGWMHTVLFCIFQQNLKLGKLMADRSGSVCRSMLEMHFERLRCETYFWTFSQVPKWLICVCVVWKNYKCDKCPIFGLVEESFS